ncbi:uncharacterized protein LOC119720051 isoform X4 [Patiria miniata]|uniref:Uncharacterized protein n=1 Tax=Patiria miniata TaxID=46514 RepID=A0A913Z0R7_PATMI|nr:uncharacterized protein LOC119720051 isoform X4 [Patiria miniata]
MDCSSPHEILFPFAEPDAVYLASTDEGTSVEIPLPFNMAVFDQNHGSLYVNINGSISFDGAQIPFVNIPQSGNKHLILPFFSNITTERVGFVTYRHFLRTPENERLFCEADEIVGDVFSGQSNFSASFMLIATWYKVPSKTPGPTRNTFQAVLVTDGTRSFAMFNYEDIQWSYAQRDQVGFDAGDGVNFYLISEARTADIVNIDERSNIGIRGRWLFRIDQSSVELPTMNTTACEIATTCHIPDGAQCEGDGNPQGCTCSGSPQQCSCSLGFFGLDCSKILFPFGLRDDIVNNGDFDSSGEIPIPVEFPFFGRYFNSIFVGFHGGDGINYYEVPGSQSNDIVNMDQRSNINTIGRWIFRIDLPEIQGPVVMSCPSAIVHNGNTFWNPLSVMAFNLTDSSTVSASCNIRHLRGGRDTIVTSDYLLPSYAARITCYAPSTSPVATCRFDVTFDNVAPVFQSCQSQVVYATPGTNQSIVVLDPDLFSAIDAVGGPVSVSCSFLNEDSVRVSVGLNSTFPLGMMTVDCEASDAAGNTAFCQLNVTVLESPPPTTEQMPTTGPKDSTTYDTTNGQILTSETTEIKTPVTAVTMSPATDDQTPATAATESLSTDDQTAASDTTVALSTDDQSPATAATVDPSTDDQTPTSDATECPSDDQTPAIAAPMSPSTDDQTPATAAPMSPSTDDQTPATAAPMSPSTDDQTPATAAPMSPSTDDQTPATAAPMSSSTDDQTPATAAPMSPSTDDQTPATAAPMSPSTDDQTPATAAPMSPSTDDQTPATAAPMSPSTDDQTPVTAAPMSPSTDDQTPASAAPMSPSTDDQTPATAAPMSPSTDDQTPATAAPMSPSTDDQTPATAAPMSPSTDDQTPATAAPMSPSTDDQTPATAAPMSPSTDDQTPATAAPMSPSTDDQTPVTAAPMSPSTDDQTPATAAPMSPSTDDQTPATAAPMSLSTDNQTPATTTPMSQSTDAQTHDGTSEYPSGYQTTATDSPTPVCELTESSCQQGTFDEDHCECVCPVSISGRTCQVPNPCLDPTLCPGEEEYCVANIFNPVGYDCVCDALLGYLTEDGGSCTRYIARVFRLRVLGINGIAVDFLPAFGNPTSSASSEALGIIRGVLLFILKRNPLTSAVRDVTDISILSGGSIIVEFVALYNNTDTALVVPSVQIIQSVLQTQSRLEGESDYLAVDTQYVTTEQTTSTCPMNYCANGGTCDIVGLYPMFTLTCRCSTSFTGEHCDSVIPLMGVVPTAPRTDAPTEPPGEGVLPTILIIVIMIVVFVLALLILGFLCIMMRRRIILNRIPIAFKSPDRPSTGRGPDFSRRVWRAEDDANIAVFAPAWQRHLGTRFPARAVNGVRSVPQLQQIPPERSSDFMTPYMVPDFVEMPLHENQGRPMEHSKGQYWPNPAYSGQY